MRHRNDSDARHTRALLAFLVPLASAWILVPSSAAAVPLYADVTDELGVGVESTTFLGPGCAMADVDGDGDLDLYVVDGLGDPNRLFRNDGNHVFTEAAAAFGLDDSGYGKSTTFVDYDNDGDKDFLLARFGPTEGDRLFRNNGDGTFTDVSVETGFSVAANYHTGAAWADYDNDGWVDCYITCYAGTRQNCLMKNMGDGQFIDVAQDLGLWNNTGYGFQPGWIDYDLDGNMDLYLANDIFGTTNRLYHNNGDGTFTDVSEASGADQHLSTMGLAIGDLDQDGDPDMYMSNIYEGNVMLRNNGDGTFTDITVSSGTGVYKTCWGSDFLDYDNDGRLDLYVCAMLHNGNPGGAPVPNKLFRNMGNLVFQDVSVGSGADNAGYSYGSAQGDYDNDGDLDIYVTNWYSQEGAPQSGLLENLHVPRGGSASDFIRLNLVGTVSNRDAIGARVELSSASGPQYRWVQCGTSYVSCSEPTLHFGMGTDTIADYIRVYWPSGLVQTVTSIPSGSVLTIVENEDTSGIESDAASTRLELLGASPNPARVGTTIRWAGLAELGTQLTVIDATGRTVRELSLGGSTGSVWWDGRDESGRELPSGVYFVAARGPAGLESRTSVTLIR
ncbi:MAG: FG-GAP-like repeat-containing protein [Candidatus Eisenbacteria bacterium]